MSNLEFSARRGEPQNGEARYIRSEGSFDFKRPNPPRGDDSVWSEGGTSLLIDTLQVEIDVEHGTALYVWGYHPQTVWTLGSAVPSQFHGGVVVVSSASRFIPGVSLAVAEIGEWTTTYDQASGWVSVCSNPPRQDDQTILIASGTLLGLVGKSLNSIWVMPVFF